MKASTKNPIVPDARNEDLNKAWSLEPVLPRWNDNFMMACGGTAGVAGLVDLLDEDGFNGANAVSSVGTAQTVGQDAQALRALANDLGSNLIRHASSRCVGAG